MPALVRTCPCGNNTILRSRDALADALANAMAISTGPALTAQLFMLVAELRGHCTDCTWRSAGELAALTGADALATVHPKLRSNSKEK